MLLKYGVMMATVREAFSCDAGIRSSGCANFNMPALVWLAASSAGLSLIAGKNDLLLDRTYLSKAASLAGLATSSSENKMSKMTARAPPASKLTATCPNTSRGQGQRPYFEFM